MQAVRLVSTEDISHEEWLKIRKKGIGGSDIAAIAGLNHWKSPLALYWDKVGEQYQQEDNIAMELGRELEPFLRKKFEKWMLKNEGFEVEVMEEKNVLRHPEHEWMIANIDGKFEHPKHGLCLLELKTASERMFSEWEDNQLPDSYYCQIQWYLAVTGLKTAYIGYLIGNRKFDVKEVIRNDDVIGLLIEKASDFWHNNILAKVPPAPVGFNSDTDILKKLYPEEEKEKAIELHDMQSYYDEYKQLTKRQKELEVRIEVIKQLFMSRLEAAEVGYVGKKRITWKTQERKGYIVEPSVSRVFRIW